MLTINRSNNVNTAVEGIYFETYTATDAIGNVSTLSRKVVVSDGVPSGFVRQIDNSDVQNSGIVKEWDFQDDILAVNGELISFVDSRAQPGHYWSYYLYQLPLGEGDYQIKMNTVLDASFCDAFSYQILDENGSVIESFLADHSTQTGYGSVVIGYAKLQNGYSIRADIATSQCSGSIAVKLDQLELVAL